MKITLTCCLCNNELELRVNIGQWKHINDEIEGCLCPEHALVGDWKDAQCAGCVGGFVDCSLWRAFAYSGSCGLNNEQYQSIEAGVCPFRTNGTLSFNTETREMKKIDLSEQPNKESGICFANAIKDYWKQYHKEANNG